MSPDQADIEVLLDPAVAKIIKSGATSSCSDITLLPSELPMEGQQTQAKQEPISNLRVIRQASTYLPGMWEYMASIPAARPLLTASLNILHAYSLMESDSIAESSEILSRKLLAVTPAEDMPVDVFGTWLTLGPLIDNALASNPPAQTVGRSASTLEVLRRRSNSIMLGFRVVTWTLEHCRVTDAFA